MCANCLSTIAFSGVDFVFMIGVMCHVSCVMIDSAIFVSFMCHVCAYVSLQPVFAMFA